ncbi:hypothetical protein C8R46DRAFT_1059452 [Mycena filopes]|nr:hypothetical protein C8R46DRAFT_1059452 [Mycena filopes]
MPFLQLITQTMEARPDLAASDAVASVQLHYERILQAQGPGKTRPCVILPKLRDKEHTTQICLMATFNKADPGVLPPMYQEFILPIFPNHPRAVDGTFSMPKYSPAIKSDHPKARPGELARWGRNPLEYSHICDTSVTALVTACRKKRRDWEFQVAENKGLLITSRCRTMSTPGR